MDKYDELALAEKFGDVLKDQRGRAEYNFDSHGIEALCNALRAEWEKDQQPEWCPGCCGSGESTYMDSAGPDAREVPCSCPYCNGENTLAAAYRIQSKALKEASKVIAGLAESRAEIEAKALEEAVMFMKVWPHIYGDAIRLLQKLADETRTGKPSAPNLEQAGEFNKETRDQIAAVMLQHGSPEQQAEALRYCSVSQASEQGKVERDAMRYRWLRGGKEIPPYSHRWPRWDVRNWDGRYWYSMFAEQLDQAIDAAMLNDAKEGK